MANLTSHVRNPETSNKIIMFCKYGIKRTETRGISSSPVPVFSTDILKAMEYRIE